MTFVPDRDVVSYNPAEHTTLRTSANDTRGLMECVLEHDHLFEDRTFMWKDMCIEGSRSDYTAYLMDMIP